MAMTAGMGDCNGSVTSAHANAAVWAACFSGSSVTSLPPGWTAGANNNFGDRAAYKLTSDPAGTNHAVTFGNATYPYRLSIASIKPR